MEDRELTSLVRSCLKKRRYPNEQSALEAINRVHKKRKIDLRVYFCNKCLGYHLTHKMEIENGKNNCCRKTNKCRITE